MSATLDAIFDKLGDKLAKAVEANETMTKEQEVDQTLESILESIEAIEGTLAPPDTDAGTEGGAVYKAFASLTAQNKTIGEALEKAIERIEAIESGTAVRKSLDGQDGDKGDKDSDLNKGVDTGWDAGIKHLIDNPGKRVAVES